MLTVKKNIYFLIHQKHIAIPENESSTEEGDYQY